ncbi:MAG: hypothetical protein F6K50_36885 [Moorea sp. SIO3I7]|nr:hypothetical protein [Moorena sp. SIO3I7]NEO51225.1 hypothetical protein [Moorena sp. SIO4A3]
MRLERKLLLVKLQCGCPFAGYACEHISYFPN